ALGRAPGGIEGGRHRQDQPGSAIPPFIGETMHSNAIGLSRRSPLFCGTALAAAMERAEPQLSAGASRATRVRRADDAGFVMPIAGGVASFAEHDSPFNKVAGLGFGGVPEPAVLDQVERAFAAYD